MKNEKMKKWLWLNAFFGPISPPPYVSSGKYPDSPAGLFLFLNYVLKLLILGAGIFTLFNLIFAGYGFMAAGGNTENMTKAWNKIWQSLTGLLIVVGALVIAGVVGQLFFGDPKALIVPKLYGPEP